MAELAENRVYLAQGAYAKAIGQNERQAAICEKMHYGLVALHLLIQSAASYAMLGRSDKTAKLACDRAFRGLPCLRFLYIINGRSDICHKTRR